MPPERKKRQSTNERTGRSKSGTATLEDRKNFLSFESTDSNAVHHPAPSGMTEVCIYVVLFPMQSDFAQWALRMLVIQQRARDY